MDAKLLGRLLLSLVLLATIVAMIGFGWIGWTGEHVFNPDWHPHARFHAAQQTGFAIAMSVVGLWLVWRRSLELRTVMLVAAAFPVLFWGAEFFAFFVPGTSPSPVPASPNMFSLLGFEVYGNLFFSGAMVALSVLGGLLISAVGGHKRAG